MRSDETKKIKTLVPEDDSFLEVNKFELDREWVEQPGLYHKFSRKLAKCIEKLEIAENNVELVEAQLGQKIRENPEQFGCSKSTDKAVKDTVICHPLYQNAVAEVAKAKYNKSLLTGTCNALEQRKEGIQDLVKLHGKNYFADPRADSEEDKETMRNIEKRSVRSRGKME